MKSHILRGAKNDLLLCQDHFKHNTAAQLYVSGGNTVQNKWQQLLLNNMQKKQKD